MHVVTCVITIFPELRDGSNSKNAIFFSMFLIIYLRIMGESGLVLIPGVAEFVRLGQEEI